MKYTSYKQIREATEEDLKKIDPEDYTDEELMQVQRWLTKTSLELVPEEKLIGLDETDKMLLGLDKAERETAMKYTSYKQIREATGEELCAIDPDDYTDEEHLQLIRWLFQAEQEFTPAEKLIGISKSMAEKLGFYNENILNEVINEFPDEFTVDGKKIFGREIITYPEFSIVKEDAKNNYYRIFH